ncbi:MAG: DNA repair protein RecO [Bacteroidales bacterium]|nr:MAG: DNA repair protein RecO [Bacteroidales bacterium]
MILSTKAIVLHSIPYSDSKTIVTLYTKEEGLMSAMYRIGKKSTKKSLIEPSSLVSVVLKKSKGTLLYINDIATYFVFRNIYLDAEKRLVALFMAEAVYRTTKAQYRDTQLYDFLEQSIQQLDALTLSPINFAIAFLIEYGRHLGIYPNMDTYSVKTYFDMQNGVFVETANDKNTLSVEQSSCFASVLNSDTDTILQQNYNIDEVNMIFDMIIEFLELHLPEFRFIKSLDIIRQVI